jgi:hypothetical protein
VFLHGRFSGNGQSRALIAADIVRIANGLLAEHLPARDAVFIKNRFRAALVLRQRNSSLPAC